MTASLDRVLDGIESLANIIEGDGDGSVSARDVVVVLRAIVEANRV